MIMLKQTLSTTALLAAAIALTACQSAQNTDSDSPARAGAERSFNEDVAFLKQYHPDTVVLSNDSGASVAVVPGYQGRIMTSAIDPNGTSFGWISYDNIEKGIKPAARHLDVVIKLRGSSRN